MPLASISSNCARQQLVFANASCLHLAGVHFWSVHCPDVHQNCKMKRGHWVAALVLAGGWRVLFFTRKSDCEPPWPRSTIASASLSVTSPASTRRFHAAAAACRIPWYFEIYSFSYFSGLVAAQSAVAQQLGPLCAGLADDLGLDPGLVGGFVASLPEPPATGFCSW